MTSRVTREGESIGGEAFITTSDRRDQKKMKGGKERPDFGQTERTKTRK